MPVLLNSRWETFVQEWFSGTKKEESALIAGYSKTNAASIATRLSKKAKVLERYEELKSEVSRLKVAGFQERQEILSEIARDKLSDFVDEFGVVDRRKLTSHAIQAVDQVLDNKRGAILKLRLHSPAQAIDLLNKMDKIYEAESKTINYNDIKILVVYDDSNKRDNSQITQTTS